MTFVSCFIAEKAFQKGRSFHRSIVGWRKFTGKKSHFQQEHLRRAEAALGTPAGPSCRCLKLPKFDSFWIFQQSNKDTFLNGFVNDSLANSLAFECREQSTAQEAWRIPPEAIAPESKAIRRRGARLLTQGIEMEILSQAPRPPPPALSTAGCLLIGAVYLDAGLPFQKCSDIIYLGV